MLLEVDLQSHNRHWCDFGSVARQDIVSLSLSLWWLCGYIRCQLLLGGGGGGGLSYVYLLF